MPTITCVHCGVAAQVTYFPKANEWTDPIIQWAFSDADLHQWWAALDPGRRSRLLSCIAQVGKLGHEQWRLGRCESCKKPVFLVLDSAETQVVRVFPAAAPLVDADVPTNVAVDYSEARLCLSVGAYKAAVTMCRRALQSAALDKGAPVGRPVDQLRELTREGILHQSLADLADDVRHFGNLGAHPSEDGLERVDKESAQAVCNLTWQILEDLYINPARSKKLKSALQRQPKPDEAAGP